MQKMNIKWGAILTLTILVVLIGGFGFLYKIIEFARTYVKDDLRSFGAISVVSYFLGVLGILFFTLWGVFKGHFKNIEKPKYRMLELDDEIDKMGNVFREKPKSESSAMNAINAN